MRKIKRVFTACLLAAAFAVPTLPALPSDAAVILADESISDIKEKNAEREAKKKEAESKLNNLNSKADDIRGVIEELDEEIAQYQDAINELTAKRNALQAKSSVTKNELQIAMIAQENQYDRMKERIAYSYENGEIHYMDALIALEDFSNIINQSEYVEQVSSYDQQQLSELIQISKEVAEKKALLAEQLEETEKAKEDTEAEQDALQVMQDGKKAKLQEYSEMISETEGEINEIETLIAEGNAEIERLEEEYKRKQEEAKRQREEAARKAAESSSSSSSSSESSGSSGSSSSAEEKYEEPEPTYNDTGWVWPCPASHSITSYFGNRSAPVAGATTYHEAIDVGVGIGNSVVAMAGGTVMYTSSSGARGNYIRIDHGGGITSLYQHLSGFGNYSAGDHVNAGDVIGYSGMTGICSGPHLHFEIWVNGTPVNPLNYVS